MARNGSGTYTPATPGNPVVTGTAISSTAFNNTINDIAAALTQSISADGQTPITADIPLSGKKITNTGGVELTGTTTSTGDGIVHPAANTVSIYTAGVERLKVDSSGNVSASGSFGFTGTGNRITGDFSNATIASRVLVQSSTTNGNTELGIVPNGTSNQSYFEAFNTASPANSSGMQVGVDNTVAYLRQFLTGAGSYLPMTFWTGGSERMRIDTSGNVIVTSTGGLGYGTGSGGTVTQATSKSTAVTLNKTNGQITMNNAALAGNTSVAFSLFNSAIVSTDIVIVHRVSGGTGSGAYLAYCDGVGSGQCVIVLRNMTAGSLSEAVVLNFAVIKAVTA